MVVYKSREDRDPEIAELSREIHNLTGQIKILASEINKASILLVERAERPYNGGPVS
jgi:peptidoglycan hydrolase CwlO-like protein